MSTPYGAANVCVADSLEMVRFTPYQPSPWSLRSFVQAHRHQLVAGIIGVLIADGVSIVIYASAGQVIPPPITPPVFATIPFLASLLVPIMPFLLSVMFDLVDECRDAIIDRRQTRHLTAHHAKRPAS